MSFERGACASVVRRPDRMRVSAWVSGWSSGSGKRNGTCLSTNPQEGGVSLFGCVWRPERYVRSCSYPYITGGHAARTTGFRKGMPPVGDRAPPLLRVGNGPVLFRRGHSAFGRPTCYATRSARSGARLGCSTPVRADLHGPAVAPGFLRQDWRSCLTQLENRRHARAANPSSVAQRSNSRACTLACAFADRPSGSSPNCSG